VSTTLTNDSHFLDITLLGKEYRVACPPDERDALMDAVAYVDEKMRDIAEKTHSNIAERIAVMAALNIAHEFLAQTAASTGFTPSAAGGETALDIGAVKRRISRMEAQLDSVLAPQDKLL